jgi:hypothetical protein
MKEKKIFPPNVQIPIYEMVDLCSGDDYTITKDKGKFGPVL